MFKKTLLFFVALLITLSLSAQGQSGKVSIGDKSMTVRQLLTEVEAQSGYSFAYDNADIDLDRTVNARAEKEDVVLF